MSRSPAAKETDLITMDPPNHHEGESEDAKTSCSTETVVSNNTQVPPVADGDETRTQPDCTLKEKTPPGLSGDACSGDAGSESDEDLEATTDHNPEPPAELLNRGDLISADKIGDTVFSKHWLFTTLMRLIQVVDDVENKDVTVTEAGVDLDDSLQDELCRLWDMSMNSDVVGFLQEFKAVDILTGVIATSKAPRATEICVGILGNMGCNHDASKEMSENDKLIKLVLLLLSDPDTPTLVETMRLLVTAMSSADFHQPWVDAVKAQDSFLDDVIFILSSSTNSDLLRNTAMFLDKLLDMEDDLCTAWALPKFVTSLIEGIKQIGTTPGESLDPFLHILQILSTTEPGVKSLVTNAEEVCCQLEKYLVCLCADEIVGVEGNENAIASTLSTLNVIMMSSQLHAGHLLQECELVRCLLKILEVVFPKVHPEQGCASSRRRTTSEVHDSPRRRSSGISLGEQSPTDTEQCGHKPANGEDRGTVKEETEGGGEGNKEEEYDRTRTNMLYETLQSFSSDLVAMLDGLDSSEDPVPVLHYLDRQCSRDRLYKLVWTLQDLAPSSRTAPMEAPPAASSPPPPPLVEGLRRVAERHSLSRLARIIGHALQE